ncbi:MAG: Fic family protein [Bacilli bacterium]|nr:Fic family protein [Bacilli bacterium]
MAIILKNENNKPFIYSEKQFINLKANLDNILSYLDNNTLSYAKKTIYSLEIKNNNLIEGLRDDLSHIEEVIKTKQFEPRITNLYNGYKYILKNDQINKESLKKLYDILSANLLEAHDLNNMGPFYRNGDVYVFESDVITKPGDKRVDASKLDYLMNLLFEYINTDNDLDITDTFIKSQIIHFYLVNIHPYFDVNGRTSRTLAMWYLLNNEAYSYIIFNRGINFNKAKYYEVIKNSRKYSNLNSFVNYMLLNVKDELIKEVAIKDIKDNKKDIDLSLIDIQTINYLLSMHNNLTIKDFHQFYSRFNDKIPFDKLKEELLEPLIDKELIIMGEYSKSNPNNQKFMINEDLIPTYLQLKKKI